jgi:hypothetical protein
MNVAQYTFQSPYPSPVQVGRLDPSSQNDNSQSADTSSLLKATNQTEQKAQMVQESIKSEAKPVVSTPALLDLYA